MAPSFVVFVLFVFLINMANVVESADPVAIIDGKEQREFDWIFTIFATKNVYSVFEF